MQIKICGLTDPDQAASCVDAGADAIGLVFYPPSPRNISPEKGIEIRNAIEGKAALVGVFVNMPLEKVEAIYKECRLNTVQLHGEESPEYVRELSGRGIRVVKALKSVDILSEAALYKADAFLLELGKGVLPGGNGAEWDFSLVAGFDYPFALSGGIGLHNVDQALSLAKPHALDLSSSVEVRPGIKNLQLVMDFITAARASAPSAETERVF